MPLDTFTDISTDESQWVNEGSTAVFTIAGFQVLDDESAVLSTLSYTLFDANEQVLAEVEDESVTPAETMTVVLTGEQLYRNVNGNDRFLRFKGTYNSDLGSGLTLTHTVKFRLRDQMGVG